MNVRFSELIAGIEPADLDEAALHGFVPGLLPSAGCEELALAALAASSEDLAEPDDEVFVPDHYEPNYAYPLIAWLHSPGQAAPNWKRLMRLISERNYVGVSIPVGDAEESERQVFETVARVRKRFHLHTERVYLLGFEEAGTHALQLALTRPDWFGGVAAVSARFPKIARPLARYDELRGRQVFLARCERDHAVLAGEVRRTQKLLWSAGMRVTCCTSSADDGHAGLLREIDRWIMREIEQPELMFGATV